MDWMKTRLVMEASEPPEPETILSLWERGFNVSITFEDGVWKVHAHRQAPVRFRFTLHTVAAGEAKRTVRLTAPRPKRPTMLLASLVASTASLAAEAEPGASGKAKAVVGLAAFTAHLAYGARVSTSVKVKPGGHGLTILRVEED